MLYLSPEILNSLEEAVQTAIVRHFEGRETALMSELLPVLEDALVEVCVAHGLVGEERAQAVALVIVRLMKSQWKAPAFAVKAPAPVVASAN